MLKIKLVSLSFLSKFNGGIMKFFNLLLGLLLFSSSVLSMELSISPVVSHPESLAQKRFKMLQSLSLPVDIQRLIIQNSMNTESIALQSKYFRVLKGHADRIRCVASLGKGIIASGCNDGQIKIWNVLSGNCLRTFPSHGAAVVCLEALPGGRVVASYLDNKIIVWSLKSGAQLLSMSAGETEWPYNNLVRALMDLGDGRFAAIGAFGETFVCDLSSGDFANLIGSVEGGSSVCRIDLGGGKVIDKNYSLIELIVDGRLIKTKSCDVDIIGWIFLGNNLNDLYVNVEDNVITIADLNESRHKERILRKYYNLDHPMLLEICLSDGPLTFEDRSKIKSLFGDKVKLDAWIDSIHEDLREYVKSKISLN